ncbi:hypothetical protein EPUL_005784, partial [Erysiphe pulchra]
MLCGVHGSSDRPESDVSMEVTTVVGAEDSSNLDLFEEEGLLLPRTSLTANMIPPKSSHIQSVGNQRSATIPTNPTWAKIAASQDRAVISFNKRNIKSFPPQVPDSSLVSNVWNLPSVVAILALKSAKAATILRSKSAIDERFSNATVERQETWTTFVIGPIQKQIRCLDDFRDPMDELLREELASVH